MRPRRVGIAGHGSSLEQADPDSSSAPSEPLPEAHRGAWRPTHWLIFAAGAALLGTYALSAVALNLVVNTEDVRGWLAPRASAALNRPVVIGGTRVALLPRPALLLSNVRVDNLQGFDGPALAFVEGARLELAWLPLLVGRARATRLSLERLRVYLGVSEDGTSNFGDLVPGSRGDGQLPEAPIGLAVKRVHVSDGSLTYFDAPGARSFTVAGADLTASLATDGTEGWRAAVELRSDSLHARAASLTEQILRVGGPSGALVIRADGTGQSVEIEEGSVELAGEHLLVAGRLAGLGGGRPSYDLQLTNDALHAEALALLVPSGLRSERIPHLDGTLGVTLQVAGAASSGRPPSVRGAVRLHDVGLLVSGKRLVEDLRGVVGITPDTLALDSVSGVFAEGSFQLSGTMERESRALSLTARARPDMDALDRLGLVPAGATLSGNADLDVSIVGDLDAAEALEVSGRVTLAGVQAKHPKLEVPLYVPAGTLDLSGRTVTWEDLEVLLGEDHLVTTGRYTDGGAAPEGGEAVPEVAISVRAPHLDLGAVLPATGPDDATWVRLAIDHLGGRRFQGRAPAAVLADLGISRPSGLPARGSLELDVDTLDLGGYGVRSFAGRVTLRDSTLVVDVPSFEIWGGTASGALTLAIGSETAAPFALSLTADGADAEALLAATSPFGDAITGSMGLDLAVHGLLDRSLLPVDRQLSGTLRIDLEDGRLRDTAPNLAIADFLGSEEWSDVGFGRWETVLEIVDGSVDVTSSTLDGAQGRVAMSGLLAFDGSVDLAVGLSIPPERLSEVSLRRTGIGQTVLDQLASAGSSLDLGLRLSGTLTAPVVEPDASNALALAR